MILPKFGQPLPASEKRIILGEPTHQLFPLKYPWMYDDYYKLAKQNHWEPTEVPLGKDRDQYLNELTDAEKDMFNGCLAMLTTQDLLVMSNLEEGIERHLSCPEASMYLARQTFEEALHTESYQVIIEALALDPALIYEMYLRKETLYAKVQFAYEWHRRLMELRIADHTGMSGIREFIKAVAFWSLGFEGGFFYQGFNFIFALRRRGLMPGSAEMFLYIRRDEAMHFNFWVNVINTLRMEYPDAWTDKLAQEIVDMLVTVVDLEAAYAYDICQNIVGYTAKEYMDHFKHMMNQNLYKLGIPAAFKGTPSMWISEIADIKKETNFFEGRVIEYQKGAMTWGDEPRETDVDSLVAWNK